MNATLALVTKVLILSGVAVFTAYDIVAYLFGGGDATESTTVGNWITRSLWVVLALGLLVGHFMGSGTAGQLTWKHGAVLLVGLVLGFVCTVL